MSNRSVRLRAKPELIFDRELEIGMPFSRINSSTESKCVLGSKGGFAGLRS